MHRLAPIFVALVVAAGCSAPDPRPAVDPTGPPHVRPEVVARHAAQFDDDLRARPAGSQEELAAATYILGHLQQGGYATRLDAVPVQDLVRTTNVHALAPGGKAETIVVVPYDLPDGAEPTGRAIGVFLEAARALLVIDPRHRVAFVALGGERSDLAGGRLGSRRLARQLLDEESSPTIVTLGAIVASGPARAAGSGAHLIEQDVARAPVSPTGEVFEAAGLEQVTIEGGAPSVGRLLVRFLAHPRG